MKKILKTALILTMLCGLALIGGCGESNPLIGKWEGFVAGKKGPSLQIEFTNSAIISMLGSGGPKEAKQVSKYDIQGKVITVLLKDGNGVRVNVVDPSTIEFNGLEMKKLK